MKNSLKVIPGKQNPIEFDVNIEGTSGDETEVRMIIAREGDKADILVRGEKKEGGAWCVTIPSMSDKKKTAFAIEVIADGYHFPVHSGQFEFVTPVTATISKPEITNKALEKAEAKAAVSVKIDKEEDKKEEPKEEEKEPEKKEEKSVKEQLSADQIRSIFGTHTPPPEALQPISVPKTSQNPLIEQGQRIKKMNSILSEAGIKQEKGSFSTFLTDKS
jgi:hypothetical protein